MQELERALLIHGTHAKFVPFVPNAQGPQLDGRNAHTRLR